jgi:uncharacterized membrane protein YphA (DoxX/SURF4 family)
MTTTLLPSVLITLMYFLAGFSKIKNFDSVVNGFAGKLSLPVALATLAIVLVIILEIAAPAVIVAHTTGMSTNRQWAKWSALALAGFTLLATVLYHFPPTGSEYYKFMSNLTALGALLLLFNCL